MYKKIFWLTAFAFNGLIILAFWWQSSGDTLQSGSLGLLTALGRLSGLLAAYFILLQFFLMGRTPLLERAFGLDKLSRLHHLSGQWGIIFLLAHPLLLTFSYSRILGISFGQQISDFLFRYEEVGAAVLALVIFLVVVSSSIYLARKNLPYEWWYFIHLAAYLAVFLSFSHQMELGTDLNGNIIFYGYWLILYIVVFVSQALFRFLRPLYFFYQHRFYVKRVVRENYNTVSLYIGGRNLNAFPVQAGQFMILRFLTKKLWWQAHPFSLSLAPHGQELRVTIKGLGDFTNQVANVAAGAQIIIDGPYGVFTELKDAAGKILLIAGGIGITPIRSLA